MNSIRHQSNNVHADVVKNVARVDKNGSDVTKCTDVNNDSDVNSSSKKNAKSNAETTTITIVLNNQSQTCESSISIDELAHGFASNIEGTAIAYNGAILSKSQWSLTHLKHGDHIDIFTLVAGG